MFCSMRCTSLKRINLYKNFSVFSKYINIAHKNSLIEKPGKVSPVRGVPSHIQKPDYTNLVQRKDIEIKNKKQIDGMKNACKVARQILNLAGEYAKPGITTDEIDLVVHNACIEANVYPSPLLYKGFPKSVCTSVNNVACHGIPDDRPLEDGDIVNIDVTVFCDGFHGDLSETFAVGRIDNQAENLMNTAKSCRDLAIDCCGPGVPLNTIGHIIYSHARDNKMSIIPHFCGHGIGEYFHGPPEIIHFPNVEKTTMKAGMTFTIEPILSETNSDDFVMIDILDDKWTALSQDQSRSAQYEHTILITEQGCDILTQ